MNLILEKANTRTTKEEQLVPTLKLQAISEGKRKTFEFNKPAMDMIRPEKAKKVTIVQDKDSPFLYVVDLEIDRYWSGLINNNGSYRNDHAYDLVSDLEGVDAGYDNYFKLEEDPEVLEKHQVKGWKMIPVTKDELEYLEKEAAGTITTGATDALEDTNSVFNVNNVII